MTAEGDDLAIRVTAIGVAAIAVFQLEQRQMPRDDIGGAQLFDFGGFERRWEPPKIGDTISAQLARIYFQDAR